MTKPFCNTEQDADPRRFQPTQQQQGEAQETTENHRGHSRPDISSRLR